MEGQDLISAEEREAFAQFLSDARQHAGVSLDDISQRTKVSTRYLEALESGRVEELPAAVYRRAILRAYAASVGLDERIAMDWFERVFGDEAARPYRLETPADPPPAPASVPWTWTMPSGRTIAVAASIVLVLAVGARAVWSRAAVPSDAGVTASLPVESDSGNEEVATVGEHTAVERSDIRLPDPPPPPPPPSSPRLVVTSRPAGARVTVDGIGWGVTPVTIRHLPPGEKVIRVTKDGYLGRERRVQIEDGGSAAVRVTLRPRG